MTIDEGKKKKIAIFASPKCTESPKLYKDYFNVAWFVQAYADVLNRYDEILTTHETKKAVADALGDKAKDEYWRVPTGRNTLERAEAGRAGFDGQVYLAGAVARREVERVLMFMDPLDTKEYLPETYAFIRNCTLADVGLHINLGATYWAESHTQKSRKEEIPASFGGWRKDQERSDRPVFSSLLNPDQQTVYFIAHEMEKEKLSRFVYHYRKVLSEHQRTGWTLSGTSGTCDQINAYLKDRLAPYWETPTLKAAGTGTMGHGPTGGDVVIAAEICKEWPVEEEGDEVNNIHRVRDKKLSDTVLFFIDYYHAQPHEADIHVLLRTCLNPHRGIHLILNERTAIEWGETIRDGYFKSTNLEDGKGGPQ